MTNKQIVEAYKNGITHSGFSVFYCKELDKYIVRPMPIDAEEREKVLRDFKEEGVPPEGYTIAIQNSGVIIKKNLKNVMKREVITVLVTR
jgi:UDP-galactopyranose mutase